MSISNGVNTLKIGIFILLAFVSIVTYGWQCGEVGQNQYDYYPYSWISGSSTGVISTSYSATLTAVVNPGGVATSVYFEWGSVYGWTATTPRNVGNGNADVAVTESVTNLLPNTTYSYRLAILREGDATPTFTANQSFTTAGRPSCTTEIATSISSLSATLNASINPNGLASTAYFQWGLSSSYGNRTADQSIGSGTVNIYVAANISGLIANTNYFFRVVAFNAEGTVYGENRLFTSGPPFPIATTSAASGITYNSAVLNGLVNPNNQDTTVYFQWGQTTAYERGATNSQIIPASINNVSVSANLTGLAATTTYYFRLTARNPAGESYGAQQSFTTPAPPPSATTTPAVTTTNNSAILTGTVNPNGLATTAYFQYGTSTAYGSTTIPIQSAGSGITDVGITATIIGLVGSTTYNYRIVATNASGTTYGSNQSFTTLISPPTATTLPATAVAANSATLNGSVNPSGGATTAYFDWGTSIAYGNTTTPTSVGSGTGPVSISQALTGLTSSTTYYFRVVAVNGTGTTNGNGLQFTTLAQAPTVVTLPASDVTSSSGFTFNATVNPNGAATTAYFQYGIYSYSYNYGNTTTQSIGNGRVPITVTQGFTTSTPGVTYYFRVVAYNSGGYSYGLQQSFTTPLAGAPSVVTTPATNITQTNARLNGLVNSNGLSTTVYFRYRTASPVGSWNIQSPPLDNGDGITDWIVSAGAPDQLLLPVLSPNRTYNFQVYATNVLGQTTYGSILSFTTLP